MRAHLPAHTRSSVHASGQANAQPGPRLADLLCDAAPLAALDISLSANQALLGPERATTPLTRRRRSTRRPINDISRPRPIAHRREPSQLRPQSGAPHAISRSSSLCARRPNAAGIRQRPEGLERRHRVFRTAVELRSKPKPNSTASASSHGRRGWYSTAKTIGLGDLRPPRHHLQGQAGGSGGTGQDDCRGVP